MISGKRHYWWVFKMYFWGCTTFRAPFSPIILEKRQKSLRLVSPKLGNSHQNNQKKQSTPEKKQVAHQTRWGRASLLGSWPPPTPPPGSAPRSGPACPPGAPGTARCFAGTGWGCDKVWSLLSLLRPLREYYTLRCLETSHRGEKWRNNDRDTSDDQ